MAREKAWMESRRGGGPWSGRGLLVEPRISRIAFSQRAGQAGRGGAGGGGGTPNGQDGGRCARPPRAAGDRFPIERSASGVFTIRTRNGKRGRLGFD